MTAFFLAGFQSKSPSVAQAVAIVIEEMQAHADRQGQLG